MIKSSILTFFDNLEIYEDLHNEKSYKQEIISSILSFLEKTDVESARNVFDSFFRAYWVGIQHKENPFLELTNIMRKYEETAGRVVESQRDHYVHTVWVFILGLVIFSNNEYVRGAFEKYALNKEKYPDSYDTKNEEFFYRWGLAALFHDIAYPLEITVKQANRYLDFIWKYPEEKTAYKNIYMKMPDFNKFIMLPKLKPDKKYKKEYFEKYPFFKNGFKGNVIDLLSEGIARNFDISVSLLKKSFTDFLHDMQHKGFVDHGFYSSVIMVRWYYYLIKTTNWNPAYFYFPIIDSASAILLHNFYRHILMKDPFSVGRLKIDNHPIAFLLILCDELQEWCREGYGEKDVKAVTPNNVKLNVNNDSLEIFYVFDGGHSINEQMLEKKQKQIYKILYWENVINKGIAIKKEANNV
ncbi:MAG: hypothetical protein K8S27_04315 [Candidatus Omnitrophica bacterium]|nr:hypothetical protein [Candidatus Omnitrophota bacterium]